MGWVGGGGARVVRGVWMGRSRSLVDLVVQADRLRVLVTVLVQGVACATSGAGRAGITGFSLPGYASPGGGPPASAEDLSFSIDYGCSRAASCGCQGRGGAPMPPPERFPVPPVGGG